VPKRIHPAIKKALDYEGVDSEAALVRDWKDRTRTLCKPCWELQYCPYGPVVEDFPLLPLTRADVAEHSEYLRAALRSGRLGDGRPMTASKRKMFRAMIAEHDSGNHPETIPAVLMEASCRVFGHLCPVFFVAEPLTETKDRRTHNRAVSREVMLKVVRRDGQICQSCNEPVRDDEVEFDHIIPFSKGGPSTADNLRLIHRDCNRRKGNALKDMLHPRPIEHLFDLQRGKRRITKR